MCHIFVIYSSIYDYLFSVEPSISFLNILPSDASLHWLQMLKNKKKNIGTRFEATQGGQHWQLGSSRELNS